MPKINASFAVTLWLDKELVANDLADALQQASGTGQAKLFKLMPGVTCNDLSVEVCGLHDSAPLDKVGL